VGKQTSEMLLSPVIKMWRSYLSGTLCGVCRMQQFHAIIRSFFRSSLLCNFSCYPFPPTILLSSLTSSCHLFLGLPHNLVVPKFICNTLLGILFYSILCTYFFKIMPSLCHSEHSNIFKQIMEFINWPFSKLFRAFKF